MAGETVTSMRGSVIALQSIYETAAVARHTIGARLQLGERVFYYAKNGGAILAPATMAQKIAQVANHITLACPTSSVVGAKHIWVTLGGTAVTANMYAEGYIHVSDATTKFAMKIKSHIAQATVNGNVKINLYDPIPAVVTAASSILALTRNPWDSVIVVPLGGITAMPVGVSLVSVPISEYFWCQTWGPAALGVKGTIVAGDATMLGGTTDGFAGPVGEAVVQKFSWGTAITIMADTKTSLVYLTIAP